MLTQIRRIARAVSSSHRHLVVLLLGFSSGLPAALTAGTLQAWFTEAGLDLHTIGAVTLLVLPYSLRFLWAPLFDYFRLPGLDRRRGWLLFSQFGLVVTIALMAFLTPRQMLNWHDWTMPWLMVIGLVTALFSTSQDIVINAYQTEMLTREEQGLGAAIYVTGWRVGAIISGALALVLAKVWGWQVTYLVMAGLMGIGIFASVIGPATHTEWSALSSFSGNLVKALIAPFQDFLQRYGAKTSCMLFLLILTYKAGDALALALNTTFLLRYIGFDLATIGMVNKTVSLFAALAGGIVAGLCMTRTTLYRALMVFGMIQASANLSYVALAYWGKNLALLLLAAFAENFCSGMGTIALLGLIMALCNVRYTATQFALLSAIAFIARTGVGPLAASMVDAMGWLWFFVCCFIFSLPTLLTVYMNKQLILNLKKDT